MRPRTIREGSVGLLILVGLGLFVGLILWLRGISLGNRSYRVILQFANIAGMQAGAPVRFRGVQVGKVVQTRPLTNGVEVEVEVSPADLIMPRNVIVEANQSGLLGEASIDITPQQKFSSDTLSTAAKPLDPNCNTDLIICNNSRLPGQVGVSVDELIRASIRFTSVYSDPAFIRNVNAVAKNSAEAASEIAKLSREFSTLARLTQGEIRTFSGSARAVTQAANQLGLTAAQVNQLVVANRSTLVSTLGNINLITTQLRTTIDGLSPVVSRVQQGELLRNLEALSTNAALASANFRDISQSLNSPANLLMLQQTLDSARATFQNAQKITADLDDLTGDPAFRTNLKNLVNGLSGLVSSTEQLNQQAQLAQVLGTIDVAGLPSTTARPSVAPSTPANPASTPASTPTPTASPSAAPTVPPAASSDRSHE